MDQSNHKRMFKETLFAKVVKHDSSMKKPLRHQIPWRIGCKLFSGIIKDKLPYIDVFICHSCDSKIKNDGISQEQEEKLSTWDFQQVCPLDAYLKEDQFFPFVCDEHHIDNENSEGIRCKYCDYTFDWSYSWMSDSTRRMLTGSKER